MIQVDLRRRITGKSEKCATSNAADVFDKQIACSNLSYMYRMEYLVLYNSKISCKQSH